MYPKLSTRTAPQRCFANQAGEWPLLQYCNFNDLSREKLEQYIAQIFHTSYGARIFDYLPLLLSLQTDGQITAALGLRSAAHETLLSERYLHCSAEQIIEQCHDQTVQRQHIIELGNLVGSTPGHSAVLYLLAVAAMEQAGYQYLLFTANQKVRASINRCGFTPIVISAARAECLGTQAERWGSYYDGDPQVMLAEVKLTMAQANAQPAMRKQLQHYQSSIFALAQFLAEQFV
ncbi:thermostable hemolysin [Oceanicoccus sp. KOV_DT_Chl]|uniref:thermostable hemolysin n=1 Tax=Oceanicoccus sp. KOV_DT_Chl TaxID=1904639 RepID=UPI000C7AC61A|nr:thermostable hemolysin [Oceanicoccus sp. KOV_DT_Chl]